MNKYNMSFSIFIKTWVNDYIWIRYLLKSIEKFVEPNFDSIVIVTDTGHPLNDIPSSIHEKPIKIIYETLPSAIVSWPDGTQKKHPCSVGIGYIWAQCIKLNWDKYCESDTILQIDSDSMFTKPINLKSAYYTSDNKMKWWVREWENADEGIVQKPATDKFMLKHAASGVRLDYMPQQSWIFTREAIQQFRKFVEDTHGCTITHYLLEKSVPYWLGNMDYFDKTQKKTRQINNWGSCEYEIFGAYLDYVNKHNYEFIMLPTSNDYLPIRQSWSWGGLKKDEIKYREELLAS